MALRFPDVPPGPVARLFEELHALYRDADDPALRPLARTVGYSHETVRKVFAGPAIPRWGLLELVVEQLSRLSGRDEDEDRHAFRALRVAAREAEDAACRASERGDAGSPRPERRSRTEADAAATESSGSRAGAAPGPRAVPRSRTAQTSVLQLRIGRELRTIRSASGVSVDDAAAHLEVSRGRLQRMESGVAQVSTRDARDLLRLYEVEEGVFDEVLSWVRAAKVEPWWSVAGDLGPDVTGYELSLEEHAHAIRTLGRGRVPVLLQTEAYARESVRMSHPDCSSDDLEIAVMVVLERQRVHYARDDPPVQHAIVDESVLHRGSGDVLRDQLGFLVEAGYRREVTVQVLPYGAGFDAVAASFTLMEPLHGADDTVVVTEHTSGKMVETAPESVLTYRRLWEDLSQRALGPDESRELMARAR